MEINKSTRLYVVFQGVLAGLVAGIHGVAAVLHGNTPTGGHLLASIGVFTLIPNYLYTGIATLAMAACVTVWAVCFIHRRHGPAVFLVLAALLFLLGGGVAQVPFLLVTWAVSTRIGGKLAWWQKVLPEHTRKGLTRIWPVAFSAGYLFLSAGIGIWLVLLPPGEAHAITGLDYFCWSCLLIGLLLQLMTIAAGFSRDMEAKPAQSINGGQ
jgi:hypothetical protein